MSVDVYQELINELISETGISEETAEIIVEHLNMLGLLDYDTLKEVFVYGLEEE